MIHFCKKNLQVMQNDLKAKTIQSARRAEGRYMRAPETSR
jgi:hypothetical protein